MSGIFTDRQFREFYNSTPEKPTRLQAFLVAESLGKTDHLLQAGYRQVSEYLSHAERDIADGRREAPEGYLGEPAPAPATTET